MEVCKNKFVSFSVSNHSNNKSYFSITFKKNLEPISLYEREMNEKRTVLLCKVLTSAQDTRRVSMRADEVDISKDNHAMPLYMIEY